MIRSGDGDSRPVRAAKEPHPQAIPNSHKALALLARVTAPDPIPMREALRRSALAKKNAEATLSGTTGVRR